MLFKCNECNGKGYIRKFLKKKECTKCFGLGEYEYHPVTPSIKSNVTHNIQRSESEDSYIPIPIPIPILSSETPQSSFEGGGGSFGGGGASDSWDSGSSSSYDSGSSSSDGGGGGSSD